MNKRFKLTTVVVLLSVMGTTATAIWLSGLSATGNVISTNSQTETMNFQLGDMALLPGDNVTKNFTYNNPNSPAIMQFTWTDNVTSTDGLCHYTEGTDFKAYIDIEGTNYPMIGNGGTKGFNHTMQEDDSTITVLIESNQAICPLSGTYTLSGELI